MRARVKVWALLFRKGQRGVGYLHTPGTSVSFETVGIYMLHTSQEFVLRNNDLF